MLGSSKHIGRGRYEGEERVANDGMAEMCRRWPKEFPAFVREPAAAERIVFLAGDPDRWRNVPDLAMRQSGGSWSDHFIDMEMAPPAVLTAALAAPRLLRARAVGQQGRAGQVQPDAIDELRRPRPRVGRAPDHRDARRSRRSGCSGPNPTGWPHRTRWQTLPRPDQAR